MKETALETSEISSQYEAIEVSKERENVAAGNEIIRRIQEMLGAADGDADALRREGPFSAGKRLTTRMMSIWPENDGVAGKPRFQLDGLAPSLGNVTLRFEMMTEEGELGELKGKKEISVGLGRLFAASTPEEQVIAMQHIGEQIHHELTHVNHPGASPEKFGEGKQAYARYLSDPGEIRAHAKQFAYRYAQRYPGEPFSLAHMQAIVGTVETDKAATYFVTMNDPIKQEEYRADVDLSKTYEEIVRQTAAFVEVFR